MSFWNFSESKTFLPNLPRKCFQRKYYIKFKQFSIPQRDRHNFRNNSLPANSKNRSKFTHISKHDFIQYPDQPSSAERRVCVFLARVHWPRVLGVCNVESTNNLLPHCEMSRGKRGRGVAFRGGSDVGGSIGGSVCGSVFVKAMTE